MKRIICCIIIGIVLLSQVAAYAGNVPIDETFEDKTTTKTVASGTKSDDENYWYIKLTSGPSKTNVFGGRTWVGDSRGSTYKTWNYTFNKAKKYEYYEDACATTGSAVVLKGKKDSSSTSTNDLTVLGTFCP